MASTINEQTAIEEIGPGQFRSKALPARMGNAKPIAYGGCALGVATRAAYAAVPPTHYLYSLVGHYHGPATTTEKLVCTVHSTRTTKSFATRRVVVQQAQPTSSSTGGQQTMHLRTCMELIADFHVEEPSLAPHMTYSAPPSRPYAGPGDQDENPLLETGRLSAQEEAIVEGSREVFALNERFFETRPCREGVSAQNLNGILKGRATTQDALPLTERTSAEWVRSRRHHLRSSSSSNNNKEEYNNKDDDDNNNKMNDDPLSLLRSPADHAAALAFCLDGGLAFLPLSHDHLFLDDVAACSSLDFALRLMTPRPDFHRWHLRERRTIAGGAGRTYSEARMWDEQGGLVAVMSQQGIMRPKPEKKGKKKEEKASRL